MHSEQLAEVEDQINSHCQANEAVGPETIIASQFTALESQASIITSLASTILGLLDASREQAGPPGKLEEKSTESDVCTGAQEKGAEDSNSGEPRAAQTWAQSLGSFATLPSWMWRSDEHDGKLKKERTSTGEIHSPGDAKLESEDGARAAEDCGSARRTASEAFWAFVSSVSSFRQSTHPMI